MLFPKENHGELSPNFPIVNFNPFKYNTFEFADNQTEDVEHIEHDTYSSFGSIYRKCCFSNIGLKFTICLNALMVLINTFLIIYEIALIIKHDESANNIENS
eukprot:412546_1